MKEERKGERGVGEEVEQGGREIERKGQKQ